MRHNGGAGPSDPGREVRARARPGRSYEVWGGGGEVPFRF